MKNLLYISLIVLFFSCKKDNNQQVIPYVPVNISINLLNPDFQALKIDGGFVYVTGGANGILVYRENSGNYLAFERSCTYQSGGDCARISMDSSQLFLIDTCCGSQFTLEGNVMSGIAPYALQQYITNLNATILNINH